MKKIIISGVIIFLVVLAVGIYYLLRPVKTVDYIEQIIPNNPIAVFTSYNLAGKLEEARSISWLNGLEQFLKDTFSKQQVNLEKVSDLEKIIQNLKKEVIVSVYSFSPEDKYPDISIAVRLPNKFINKLIKIFKSKDIKIFVEEKYLKRKIYAKYIGERKALFTILGDVLVAANSLKLVRKSIDLFNNSTESLLENSGYQEAKKILEAKQSPFSTVIFFPKLIADEYAKFYLDKSLVNTNNVSTKLANTNLITSVLKELSKMKIYNFIGNSVYLSEEGVDIDNYIKFNLDQEFSEKIKIYLEAPLIAKEDLNFLPKDSVLIGAISANWDELLQEDEYLGGGNVNKASYDSIKKWKGILASYLGLGIVDFKEQIINSFSVPIPQLVCFFKTKNPSQALSNIKDIFQEIIAVYNQRQNKFTSQANISQNTTQQVESNQAQGEVSSPETIELVANNYQNATIYSLKGIEYGISPSFACSKKVCFIAIDKPIIEKLIENQNQKPVVSNFQFNSENLLGYGFFDGEILAEKIIHSSFWQQARAFIPFFTQGQVQGKDIDSVMNAIKQIKIYSQYQKYSEDTIYTNINIRINNN